MKRGMILLKSITGAPLECALYSARETEKLAVLLPGAGYTCDHPLLYYAREVALARGYDVLAVQYYFQAARLEFELENIPDILEDSKAILREGLQDGYRELAVVSKSLGTIIARELAVDTGLPARQFYLTPVARAKDAMLAEPCVAVSGSADPHLTPDLRAALEGAENVDFNLIPDADHSLDIPGDCAESLRALMRTMGWLDAFLH